MRRQSVVVTVAHSRATFARVVNLLHDRGWEIESLDYKREENERLGVLNLTATGGAGDLSGHLHNLIGVLEVDKRQ